MPASLGFHPAFRWPLPYGAARDAHFIEFETDEPARMRRLDAKGLLTDERIATPVQGRRLLLQDALFKDDVVIFDHLKSRRLTYGAATGPRIQVSFPQCHAPGLVEQARRRLRVHRTLARRGGSGGFRGFPERQTRGVPGGAGGRQSLQMRIELM